MQKEYVTISIGGTLVLTGDTTESLINRADQFMYESKKNGGVNLMVLEGLM